MLHPVFPKLNKPPCLSTLTPNKQSIPLAPFKCTQPDASYCFMNLHLCTTRSCFQFSLQSECFASGCRQSDNPVCKRFCSWASNAGALWCKRSENRQPSVALTSSATDVGNLRDPDPSNIINCSPAREICVRRNVFLTAIPIHFFWR